MKSVLKGTLCALFVLCAFLSSCGQKSVDPESVDSVTEGVEIEIDTLKSRVPQYFDLATFKGLEVYVWSMAEGNYRCGMLPGTNRNKTQREIWDLAVNSVSVGEMKVILKTYDISDEDIFLFACAQPISSYMYPIDEDYCSNVSAQFDGRIACFPIMEFMEEGS